MERWTGPAVILVILTAVGGVFSQGTDVIPSIAPGLLREVQHQLVLGNKPPSSNQIVQMNVLRHTLTFMETELKSTKFRNNVIWLRRKKAEIDRHAQNYEYGKQRKAKAQFDDQLKKLNQRLTEMLVETLNHELAAFLTPAQQKVLGIGKAKDDSQESSPHPRRRDGARWLRESDFD
jgi:hypothetical protein